MTETAHTLEPIFMPLEIVGPVVKMNAAESYEGTNVETLSLDINPVNIFEIYEREPSMNIEPAELSDKIGAVLPLEVTSQTYTETYDDELLNTVPNDELENSFCLEAIDPEQENALLQIPDDLLALLNPKEPEFAETVGHAQTEGITGQIPQDEVILIETEPTTAATELVTFAAFVGTSVKAEGKPGVLEHVASEETPPLPPICLEVMVAVQDLAPEPAEAAEEMIASISTTIDHIIELGDRITPLAEHELEQACATLFEHLNIEYNPETIMEFIAGITQAKRIVLAAVKHVELVPEKGTREAGQEADQGDGGLLGHIGGIVARALGKVSLNIAELALVS